METETSIASSLTFAGLVPIAKVVPIVLLVLNPWLVGIVRIVIHASIVIPVPTVPVAPIALDALTVIVVSTVKIVRIAPIVVVLPVKPA